jgi:hypothetical protein
VSNNVVRFTLTNGQLVTVPKQMDEGSWSRFLATVHETFGPAVTHMT